MKMDDYSIIMPGRIVEYFPATQTATVKISDTRTYSTSSVDDEQAVRPLLEDVPVFTPGGGGWHMTFPIKPDDPCLLNFSQFGYDHWLFEDADDAGIRSDGQPQPWTKRRFDVTDGFAQVGWNNIPKAIDNYKANDAEFRNADATQRVTLLEGGNVEVVTGTTKITLTADGITLDSDSTVVVNTDTATVNATTEAIIETATATINASAATDITSPLTTIDGNLTVTGSSTLTGAVTATTSVATPSVNVASGAVQLSSGGATSTGPMTATEFTAGTITLTGHKHPGDGGTGSGSDTGAPIP